MGCTTLPIGMSVGYVWTNLLGISVYIHVCNVPIFVFQPNNVFLETDLSIQYMASCDDKSGFQMIDRHVK